MKQEFRYSYNVIGFQGEDIAESIDRLARLGYDAVEVEGEPETHDPKRIKKLAEDAGLAVGSVCSNFTAERDLPPRRERSKGCPGLLARGLLVRRRARSPALHRRPDCVLSCPTRRRSA